MQRSKFNRRKLIWWGSGLAFLLLITTTIVLVFAMTPQHEAKNKVNEIALEKTPIKQVIKNYHLNRDVKSEATYGKNKNKKYYFIYLTKSKKGYLYQSTKGYSEAKIKQRFGNKHPNRTIKKINLGWYKNRPVWEVGFSKNKQTIGYAIYNFENGKEISYIDNL